MEEKKKINIFSIIALILMFLTIVFVYFGLIKANIVFVILSIICEISSVVLAIIGIVKANKLKKDIGKRKGIIFCIISIVIIIIISAISFMELVILINEIITGDTEFSAYVKSVDLTEDEKIIGQYVKGLKNSLYNIDSFKLNNLYTYKYTNGNDYSLSAIIDFSGTNLVGGVTRQFIVFSYTYDSAYVSISRKETLEEAEQSTYTTGKNKTTLDKNKILKYANEETTPELTVDYDAEKVQQKLKDAVKVMGIQ